MERRRESHPRLPDRALRGCELTSNPEEPGEVFVYPSAETR